MCLSPKALCRESPAGSHLAVNPRQQETVGEASRCSRTPAHPERDGNICSTSLSLVFTRKHFKLLSVRLNELIELKLNSKTNSHSFHLHPAVSSVHVFIANLELVAALRNKVFHPLEELVVILGAEKVATEKRKVKVRSFSIFSATLVGCLSLLSKKAHMRSKGNKGSRGRRENPTPCCHARLHSPYFYSAVFSHLHTCTSTGLRVLGVIIQGATLNTTLSVKMGVSGTCCQHGRHWAFILSLALVSTILIT